LVIFIPFIGLTFIYAIITPFVYVGLAPIINSLGALLVLYVIIELCYATLILIPCWVRWIGIIIY
jgi:hypothetical protein